MNRIVIAFCLFLALQPGVVSAGAASLTLNVTSFGVRPNSRENAVPGAKKALEACRQAERAVLIFPKGRYDFWAQHSDEIEYFESNTTDNNPKICPIVLKGFKGLTIEGSGSEFICHGRMQPLTLEKGMMVWADAGDKFGIGGRANTHFLKAGEAVELRVFVDRGVLEVYCNGVAVTHKCFAPVDRIEVFTFSEGGEATLTALEAWKMKSMWEQDASGR